MSAKIILLTVSLFLVPSFEIKVFSALALVLLTLRDHRAFSKRYMFLFLFSTFTLAYIYSPYWLAFGIRAPLQYVVLGFLFVFGLFWAYHAAEKVTLQAIKLEIKYLVLLAGVVYLVNYLPLRSDIPWRGDEEYHIKWLLDLFTYIQFFWNQRSTYLTEFVSFTTALGLMILILLYRRSISPVLLKRRVIKLLLFSLVPISAALLFAPRIFVGQKEILLLSDILRYPSFSRWLQLPFILPNPYLDVRLFRVVPFLSQVLISWILFHYLNLKLKNKLFSLLFSLAISTLPLITYYSSILYLEMPLVMCFMLCLFNLKKLVTWEFSKLTSDYTWYVLLFSLFIKETTLVIVIFILFLRVVHRLKNFVKSESSANIFWEEAKICFLWVSPLLIYVLLRYLFVKVHTPLFAPSNLLQVENYIDLFKSHLHQTGLFFMISIAGLFYLWQTKKEKFVFWTHSVLFFGLTAFFIVYYSPAYLVFGNEGVFIGYSRWNIIGLMVLISVSATCISMLKNSYRIFILLLLFSSNVLYYPFHADGVRFSNWGTLRADAAEYVYPYAEAIRWLSQTDDTKRIVWFGHYSSYSGMNFYFKKYSFEPHVWEKQFGTSRFDKDEEQKLFTAFMHQVETDSAYKEIDTLLYHSVHNIDVSSTTEDLRSFKRIKRVQNSAHSLYIFKK